MPAEDSTLGEHLRAVRAEVGLVTGVLSQVNLHVTALGEGATAAIDKAFEAPLVTVGLWVHDSNYFTHLFRDGLESLLSGQRFIIFVIALLLFVEVHGNLVFHGNLGGCVVGHTALGGQNRRCGVLGDVVRKSSFVILIIRI